MRDELTGLHNRRYFNAELHALVASRHTHNKPLAVALIDLDHFKGINDTFGHATGDRALQLAAAAIVAALPDGGVAARIGGDEFGVILPGSTREDAEVIASRIHMGLAASRLQSHDQRAESLRIRATTGLAFLDDRGDADFLLREADSALYAGKRALKAA